MKKVGADWGKDPSRSYFQIRDVDKIGLAVQWQSLNHGVPTRRRYN